MGLLDNKVQTGLRIPEERYEKLTAAAQAAGVSLNTMLLMLIDVGMKTVNLGVEEERRVLLRMTQDTDE